MSNQSLPKGNTVEAKPQRKDFSVSGDQKLISWDVGMLIVNDRKKANKD